MDTNLLESQALANGITRLNYPGYGYGYGSSSFANPAANAVRIESGARENAAAFENLLDQNQFAITNRSISESCNRLMDAQVNGEFRMGDRLRDIEREMNANAREAAKCCCDIKLQAANDKAEILAEIKATESRTVTRDLDRAERELTALKTQIACGCCGGNSGNK